MRLFPGIIGEEGGRTLPAAAGMPDIQTYKYRHFAEIDTDLSKLYLASLRSSKVILLVRVWPQSTIRRNSEEKCIVEVIVENYRF